MILNFLRLVHYKLDESCCMAKGVPEDCMGLCREETRSDVEWHYPVNKCAAHNSTIRNCMYPGDIRRRVYVFGNLIPLKPREVIFDCPLIEIEISIFSYSC